MGETITVSAADGHNFTAYRAGDRVSAVGLVVVQEIFGVNRHMRLVSNALAASGYAVICPALFDRAERGAELGYTQDDITRGLALRAQVPEAATLADIEAAAAALAVPSVGIVGYCWGGTIAWLGATRSNRFKAAVGWYGGGIAATRTETPTCPVQLHFGESDHGIPMADVDAIRSAQPGVEIFVYPGAGHGFGCEERPSYSAPDAERAQSRMLAFFKTHLV